MARRRYSRPPAYGPYSEAPAAYHHPPSYYSYHDEGMSTSDRIGLFILFVIALVVGVLIYVEHERSNGRDPLPSVPHVPIFKPVATTVPGNNTGGGVRTNNNNNDDADSSSAGGIAVVVAIIIVLGVVFTLMYSERAQNALSDFYSKHSMGQSMDQFNSAKDNVKGKITALAKLAKNKATSLAIERFASKLTPEELDKILDHVAQTNPDALRGYMGEPKVKIP